MSKQYSKSKKFYGTTTLGEKGQIVIPAPAREAMALKKGEKLLVFGFGPDMLGFAKVAGLEKFASELASRLDEIKKIINKTAKK